MYYYYSSMTRWEPDRQYVTRILSEMIGRRIDSVTLDMAREVLKITAHDGTELTMFHVQDCCESVRLVDGDEDLRYLVGSTIRSFTEVVSADRDDPSAPSVEPYEESATFTFYKIRTDKGDATLRWLGESNGYYSESIDVQLYSEEPLPHLEEYRLDTSYYNPG